MVMLFPIFKSNIELFKYRVFLLWLSFVFNCIKHHRLLIYWAPNSFLLYWSLCRIRLQEPRDNCKLCMKSMCTLIPTLVCACSESTSLTKFSYTITFLVGTRHCVESIEIDIQDLFFNWMKPNAIVKFKSLFGVCMKLSIVLCRSCAFFNLEIL